MAATPVWVPDEKTVARSRLGDFLAATGCADPRDLDRRAREDPGWFWGEAARWLGLDWQREPHAVVEGLDEPHHTRWFPGGELNIADNAVDRWVRRGRGAEPALRWETEDGERGHLTFAGLAAEVDRVAAGLREHGIGFGDRVGIQLPMVREAVVSALACAKLGAVAVLLFSGFGEAAVAQRLGDSGAVALVCADGFPRRGRSVQLRGMLAKVAERTPSLRTCVVVGLAGADVAGPRLPGEVSWDALGTGAEPVPAARCPATHPLMIAYTSGTTGAPKGITLGHAGFAVKAGTDAAWCFDVGEGDVSAWITDPGWIMSPITVLGGLVAGSAVAVYGGGVDYPDHGRVWRFAESAGVTMLGVSPTLVRTLARGGDDAVPDEPATIRVFASSGEPWTPDAFSWLFDRVGRGRVPIINYSGGTEVSGAILSNTTLQPIVSCGFAGPVPGMAAEVAAPDGTPLTGSVGELVLRRPSPGMPLGFWGEPGRYERTYWQHWPGTWLHGDFAEIDTDGVWFIRGRSDDTMNVAGKRLGPAEIEQVVGEHPGVSESAAFGTPDPVKGERVVVLVVPSARADVERLTDEVTALVRERLGAALRPHAVHAVPSLPRTRSGKILRRVIRAVYLGDSPGDLSSLDNPESIDAVRGVR
ncbi:AMP-binding protein [Amycolatopsis taiwanensis]|uniref:acetate--CoA ligase n=1 Tax=Amycolatopsis taiwanensis TaxID=342230 RepID=A0A9W6R5B2_9PSEU|nr:AMP-binding protein [Amycolatopsis taiwanensis]GLY69528.1 acetyl-CoA synthetase [Amycolatopsis taiwanensis]